MASRPPSGECWAPPGSGGLGACSIRALFPRGQAGASVPNKPRADRERSDPITPSRGTAGKGKEYES